MSDGTSSISPHIAVIGGGPAGLRAAEVAAASGQAVTLYDAKPSVGRKFLVAGRGGLNLTKSEPADEFSRRYIAPGADPGLWPSLISEFDPERNRAWAAELGVETFVASTGRVYPKEMKAAPLLRRWVQRLRGSGVQFQMAHRWIGFRLGRRIELSFQTAEGTVQREADTVVLALGGGSWPETGSDGAWTTLLTSEGIAVRALEPANCGWEVSWSEELLAAAEGRPLKSIAASAGDKTVRGELLITRYGLEGGAIYQLGPTLRGLRNPVLAIDLKPTLTSAQLVAKLGPIQRNLLAEARRRWRLDDAGYAVLSHSPAALAAGSGEALAKALKRCEIPLIKPRPIEEAISSAGGVSWSELDSTLMLRRFPGIFLAGEMIDWEAPTGGYLLQGCFATGTRAGLNAAAWCSAARNKMVS